MWCGAPAHLGHCEAPWSLPRLLSPLASPLRPLLPQKLPPSRDMFHSRRLRPLRYRLLRQRPYCSGIRG
eukprot:9175548-Alexandrium_andersonii.AAC.1